MLERLFQSTGEGRQPGRGLRRVTAGLWILTVITLTLRPVVGGQGGGGFSWCLVCTVNGGADAVLNSLLFFPLGLLVGVGRGPGTAIGIAVLLSAGIETGQLWIPGRYAGLSDIVWNGLGAGVGALAMTALRAWLRGSSPVPLRAVSVGIPSLCIAAAGLGLEPALTTDTPYSVEWTPAEAFFEHYNGDVLESTLNGASIPPGPVPTGTDPGHTLTQDWSVAARVILGTPPSSLAPIVRVNAGAGILLLGVDGEDLVWLERTRSVVLRLSYPYLHLPDALSGLSAGDTVRLGARRSVGDLCLWVESVELCGIGVSPAQTWTLLRAVGGG